MPGLPIFLYTPNKEAEKGGFYMAWDMLWRGRVNTQLSFSHLWVQIRVIGLNRQKNWGKRTKLCMVLVDRYLSPRGPGEVPGLLSGFIVNWEVVHLEEILLLSIVFVLVIKMLLSILESKVIAK
jgi:hypothetical protein